MKFNPEWSNASLEAMRPVASSKLGRDLEALFQKVIDYRDHDLKGVDFRNREKAVQAFFHKNVARQFMKAVWDDVGLDIEAVLFKPRFETSFCTWICFGKGDKLTMRGTEQIEGILNGQANSIVNDFFSKNEFSVDELIKIARSYDIEKGMIKKANREQLKQWVKCAMGFDISLGFLSVDYLPKNSGCEYLTARELTAIMLHEIGHNLTLVEHAADMYAHIASFNALKAGFIEHATEDQAIEFAQKIADLATASGYVKDGRDLALAVDQVQKDLTSAGKVTDVNGRKSCILGLIVSAFALLAIIVAGTLDFLFADIDGMFIRRGQNKKVGDTVINDRMWTWQERKADEYAFTNGYGADQATALGKIYKFYNMIGRSEEDIKDMKQAEALNQDLSFFTKIGLQCLAIGVVSDPSYRLYPPGTQRYKEIMQLAIAELKRKGASAEYINKYMDDIDRIIKVIDETSREDKYLEEAQASYRTFNRYVSIRSFLSWIVSGRIDNEIAQCLQELKLLNNNLISYFAVKLNQFAKKA